MNHYILPKNNCNIKIFLSLNNKHITPEISYSLIYHLNDVYNNLLKLQEEMNEKNNNNETNVITIEYINKIVNPFEFIHTNVPGTIISVSKVKPESCLFFDLMEIFQICNITDILAVKNKITVANFTSNYTSCNYLLNMIREDNDDTIINDLFEYNLLCSKYIKSIINFKIDLFVFEFKDEDYTNPNQYIKNILLALYIISKYQSSNGTCIIKLDGIFYKVIVEILLILTRVYDKVFLIKPSISKITRGDRYVVCKNFDIEKNNKIKLNEQLEEKIKDFLTDELNILFIHSLLKNDIPYYFLNKIEESNAVIGQQQLESYDQIINIFKNKNKEDKVDNLKRNHIQKCIQWCEKNQIPHNKFTDKINIFLNTKQKDYEDDFKYVDINVVAV
jgi:hypothetical protein